MIMARRCLFKSSRAVAAGLLLLLALTPALAALPTPVLKELRAAGIPPSSVSAVVHEIGAAGPKVSVAATRQVNPASLMKLVTTYATLELLGPAYRWKTEVYLDGKDVYLKGAGDPKLNYESFWMLLRALRGRGLGHIEGNVVLDRTWLAPVPDGRIDDDAFRPYNVAPDALLVNFKSVRFNFLPQLDRNAVRVYAEPALPGMRLLNELKVVERSCPEGRAFRELISAQFESRPPRAAFTGVYPASCGERDLNVALHHPEDYVAGMVRQLWSEMGGRWDGEVRNGVVPSTARLFYVHESEALSEIVRDVNKFSNNVMARQLYLTLGAEAAGAPARPENAERAIREWLEAKKLRVPELVLENGSGLSRAERISASSLAAILQAAWQSRVMPEFVASLPIAGSDGTMRRRMQDAPGAGHAHIKTGLLSDVRGSAGYVLDRHARRHVVVMIVNDARAPDAQQALDALVSWTYEARGRAPATARPRAASQRSP